MKGEKYCFGWIQLKTTIQTMKQLFKHFSKFNPKEVITVGMYVDQYVIISLG